MRLFINNMVANSSRVPTLREGSFMRSRATLLAGLFSSLSSTRWLGLRLKKAFSELENRAEIPKNKRITKKPKMPKNKWEPISACVAD